MLKKLFLLVEAPDRHLARVAGAGAKIVFEAYTHRP